MSEQEKKDNEDFLKKIEEMSKESLSATKLFVAGLEAGMAVSGSQKEK